VSGYPVIFELAGRLAVVVGGGAVGRRKVAGLLAAGARVRLVSREAVPPSCWQEPVEFHLRPFHPADLDGAVLALAATGDADVDGAVLAAARARGIPANLAAQPQDGDFTLPAVLRRGELLVAVATGGRAPALAGTLRDRLGTVLGPEWALVVEIAARLRTEKLTVSCETAYSHKVFVELLDAGLSDLLARREEAAINHLLTRVCGREITLAGLGLTLPDRMP
jgi:precorrin-2 dehydrogenase / sirohydrochlorin ferrochelatase